MNNLDIRCGSYGRRPRREMRRCVIHNKRLATPECAHPEYAATCVQVIH